MEERSNQLQLQINVLKQDTQTLRKNVEKEVNEKMATQQEAAKFKRQFDQTYGNFLSLQNHVTSQEGKFKRELDEKQRELNELKQRF